MSQLRASFAQLGWVDQPLVFYSLWLGDGTIYPTDSPSDPAGVGSDPLRYRSNAGSIQFERIEAGATVLDGPFALASLDWLAAGSARFTLWLPWNAIRTLEIDAFDGTRLELRNWVEAIVTLDGTPADLGRTILIDGSKRGEISTGSGADSITILADSNGGDADLNTFVVTTGAGNDQVTIGASTTDWTARAVNSGVNRAYDASWTRSAVDLGGGADRFVGGNGSDRVEAGSGNDVVDGRGGADQLFLGSGDDEATGGSGDDSADGGDGQDTWRLVGLRAGYDVSIVDGGVTVRDIDAADGDEGVDRLSSFERLLFQDASVAIEPPATTIRVLRLSSTPEGNAGDRGADSYLAGIDPSGRRIAFRSEATDLVSGSDGNAAFDSFVVGTDGTGLRRIGPAGGAANGPTSFVGFSPDGNALLLASDASNLVTGPDTNGATDAFLFDVRTNSLVRLSSVAGAAAAGSTVPVSFSPDGSRILLATTAGNLGGPGLVLVDADGANADPLPTRSGATTGVWSPDGTLITDGQRIVTVATGETVVVRDRNGAPVEMQEVFFSQDSQRLVFYSEAADLVEGEDPTPNRPDVFSIRTDGTGLVRLSESDGTALPGLSVSEFGSPDGTRILFFNQTDSDRDLYLAAIDGSTLRLVSHSLFSNPIGFSPDGTQIAYTAFAGDFPNQALALFVESLDGSGRRVLADNVNPSGLWSPDGSRILFESGDPSLGSGVDVNGTTDVFVARIDGSEVLRVSSTPSGSAGNGASRPIGFTPDGTGILFSSDATDLAAGQDNNGEADLFLALLSDVEARAAISSTDWHAIA